SKLPPLLHNLNPFRAQDFVELTEDEKDKFCEKMDEAWKSHQKTYNEGKEENKKILSEDVVRWGFEIPKKKDGRFGFRIVYRIPDKNGRYVKGQNKDRKYKVDTARNFEYKMKYLFWGKLDLDDLDNFFVESTSIVEDWENITENDTKRVRVTAKTLVNLKEKIKSSSITPIETDEDKNKTSNNCWLHTGIQSVMLDKKMMGAFKKFTAKTPKEQNELIEKESSRGNKDCKLIIECLSDCKDKSIEEQEKIIQKHSAKIREALGYSKDSQEDPLTLHRNLTSFFENSKLLPSIQATITRKLHLLDPLSNSRIKDFKPLTKSSKENNGIIELDLPNTSDTSTEIDVTELIQSNKPKGDTTLGHYSIKDDKKYKNYEIIEEETTFDSKPDAVTYHIKHTKSEDGTKVAHTLKTIPLELEYKDKKLIPQGGGTYKLKYAIIHEGATTDSGHYYVIYQDSDGKWYKNNNSSKELITEKAGTEYLKHAVYLHYEPSDSLA
nr:hypothetical protein [Candidatus Anoxychlamydiales bacterium]